MHDFYTITELTKEFGVSTRTIRFYEDEGLIHPLRRGRTRLFRQSDRQLLRNILRGKRLGFSIAEILGRVKRRREELEQKRRDIEDLLVELDQAEEACLTRLAELGIDQSRRA